MSFGDRVLMGVAGWIIAFVGAWAAIHNNGQVARLAGGASWMSPAARRFWAIVLVLRRLPDSRVDGPIDLG